MAVFFEGCARQSYATTLNQGDQGDGGLERFFGVMVAAWLFFLKNPDYVRGRFLDLWMCTHTLEQIISAFKSPVRTLFYPCSCCPRPKKPQCRTYPDCWQRRQRQCVPCLRAQSDEARKIFPRTSSFLPLPCNSHATHMQHTCNTTCNTSTFPENSQ